MNRDTSGYDRRLVSPETWLRVISDEYLAEFIPSGGSTVKVVSGGPVEIQHVQDRLQTMALDAGCHWALLDPAQPDPGGKRPDLQRIDRLFFAVTRSVDWKGLAAAQASKYLRDRGIMLSEGRRLGDLDGIAADNGRDPQDLLNQYEREYSTPQIKDHRLAYEFRSAITALGRSQLIPDAVTPSTEEVLLQWLAGQTFPGAATALKKVQIYARINQSNARAMLASFCRWLPMSGRSGLVVTLDFRPYEHKKLTKPQKLAEENRRLREAILAGASTEDLRLLASADDDEPAVSYSDAAYIQMLTLIRRFIDDIDWFERFLLVILTSPKFYDDASRRKYTDYDALQTRIGLEVHDALKANPAAALVHLGGAE